MKKPVQLNEGNIKKNTNPNPTAEDLQRRPPPPKSQIPHSGFHRDEIAAISSPSQRGVSQYFIICDQFGKPEGT